MEKIRAQISEYPKPAPDEAAVVTVPGLIKAAEITDQKRICSKRSFRCYPLIYNFSQFLIIMIMKRMILGYHANRVSFACLIAE